MIKLEAYDETEKRWSLCGYYANETAANEAIRRLTDAGWRGATFRMTDDGAKPREYLEGIWP